MHTGKYLSEMGSLLLWRTERLYGTGTVEAGMQLQQLQERKPDTLLTFIASEAPAEPKIIPKTIYRVLLQGTLRAPKK